MTKMNTSEIYAIKIPLLRGNAFFEKRKYLEAVECYLEAIEQGSSDVSVNLKLGESYFKLRNFDEAKRIFSKVNRLQPGNEVVKKYFDKLSVMEMIEEGDNCRKINDYKSAREIYYEAFELDNGNVEALYGAAMAYLDEGKINIAINMFNKLMELNSLYQAEFKYVLNNLAINLSKQKLPKKAIALYMKAITVDPEDEVLYFNLAKALIHLEEIPKAKASLKKAIEFDSSFEEAKELLEKIS